MLPEVGSAGFFLIILLWMWFFPPKDETSTTSSSEPTNPFYVPKKGHKETCDCSRCTHRTKDPF